MLQIVSILIDTDHLTHKQPEMHCRTLSHLSTYTVKPVCNDHLYNKMYYLWFIQ